MMMMGRRRGAALVAKVAAGSRICREMASPMPRRAPVPVKFKTTSASGDRAEDGPAWGSSTVAIPPETVVARASPKTTLWQPSMKVFVGQGLNFYQIRSPADEDAPEGYTDDMAEMCPRSGLILSVMQGGDLKKIAEISFRGVIGDSCILPMPPSTCGDGELKEEGGKPFYPRLLFAVYPKRKYGWMSVIHNYNNNRCFDSTVTFSMACLKSCNHRELQYLPDPTEGLLFEGSIFDEQDIVNDLIVRLNVHYVCGAQILKQKKRINLYEADGSWDGSDVHLQKIASNSTDEPIDSLIGKTLSHGSILRVHSSFRETATEVYVALDACVRTLPEYLSDTEFVLMDRLWKCVDIAGAVKAGNDVHLVNPAINTNDILVTKDGEVKIANYNKAVRKLVGRKVDAIYGNGATGNYCAPELRRRKPYDEKVEVFAIGKVFVLMLIDTKEIDKAIENLNHLVNQPGWKTDKVKLWRRSRLWKYFKCKDDDLVLSMLDDDPDKRPDVSTVIKELLAELDTLEGEAEAQAQAEAQAE